MRERDRLTIREYRENIEAQERIERDKRERPIREAEARLKDTYKKLRAVMVERLLGKTKDPNRIAVDPSVATVTMTLEQADTFNRREFSKYRDANPEVFWTPELAENIGAYFEKNGLQIVTANMLGSIIERYRDGGLLPSPPQVSEPEPETQTQLESVNPPAPVLIDGWDSESGEPRKYTQRELDRLSSTDYRKALRLYKADLALPNRGPGPA